jgi:hypothetical protein
MKRAGHRHAVGVGLLGATLVWLVCPTPMDRVDAVAHASAHLQTDVDSTSLSLDGRRWTVIAGNRRVVLDAQTGELLELDRAWQDSEQ